MTLSLDEARTAVRVWNEGREVREAVPYEWAEEAILAHWRWRVAVRDYDTPSATTEHLRRHQEFACRLPDELIIELFEVDDD